MTAQTGNLTEVDPVIDKGSTALIELKADVTSQTNAVIIQTTGGISLINDGTIQIIVVIMVTKIMIDPETKHMIPVSRDLTVVQGVPQITITCLIKRIIRLPARRDHAQTLGIGPVINVMAWATFYWNVLVRIGTVKMDQ